MVLIVTIQNEEPTKVRSEWLRNSSISVKITVAAASKVCCRRIYPESFYENLDASLTYLLAGVTCLIKMIAPFYVRNAIAEIIGHLRQRFWRAHAT